MRYDTALAPGILAEDVADAVRVTAPTPHALVLDVESYAGAQDELEGLGAGGDPATPAEALDNAARYSRDSIYVGVGYCLKTVRTLFDVAAMWPDAETAWERAGLDVDDDSTADRHPTSDPTSIPRGAVVYWTNGRYGHVALSAGGGMCWTTDYRRPGYVDLAPISALAGWCGGRLVGWAEDLNGVDVWPEAKPKPRPTFTQRNRIATVRRALDNARRNHAPTWRLRGLKRWLKQLERNTDGGPK